MDASISPEEVAEPATCMEEAPYEGEQQQEQQKLYTLPGLEGEWTMQQLVEMEMQHDPRLAQVRRSALPPEFWDARRRARNHSRLQRNYTRRKRRGEALRREESQRLAGMDEEQQAAYAALKEAEREAAKAAAAEQRQRVADAMERGLRIVIDCCFSTGLNLLGHAAGGSGGNGDGDGNDSEQGTDGSSGKDGATVPAAAARAAAASDREVRSLCKQLELCAAANKRAARPVSLHFASFTGAVRRFAVDSMHADRWPAARGHEQPLGKLFGSGGNDGSNNSGGEGGKSGSSGAVQLVVLSPDADEPLLELDPDKVYVIGGLVDRTVQKGASLRLAQACGAAAVRLPIAEHLGPLPKGKGVLNVNDVFHALLAVHAGEGWQAALERAIPQRFRQQVTVDRRGPAGKPAVAAAAWRQPAADSGAADSGAADSGAADGGAADSSAAESGAADLAEAAQEEFPQQQVQEQQVQEQLEQRGQEQQPGPEQGQQEQQEQQEVPDQHQPQQQHTAQKAPA